MLIYYSKIVFEYACMYSILNKILFTLNFLCIGILLIWIIVRRGPTALAVGAAGGCLDVFPSSISSLFLTLFG